MDQLYPRRTIWMYVIKDVLMTLSGELNECRFVFDVGRIVRCPSHPNENCSVRCDTVLILLLVSHCRQNNAAIQARSAGVAQQTEPSFLVAHEKVSGKTGAS